MQLCDFDYNLPKELIAQVPSEKRENSKMMVLNRAITKIEDRYFFEIIDCLNENDLLVLNNTKVIPARLYARKETGALIEIFLIRPNNYNAATDQNICLTDEDSPQEWTALIKPSKRIKKGMELQVSNDLSVDILEKLDDKWKIKLNYEGNLYKILSAIGNIPLPPYIERNMSKDDFKNLDYERYQTVYAQKEGSVAAPTAGLHFTQEILNKLSEKGVEHCFINLNVGLGTFKPVKCDNVLEHKMDSEIFEIPESSAEIINKAKSKGKNIVAVGTTTVRTLETVMQKYNRIIPIQGSSELFIYPGFKFKITDKIITNFHLPKSTLLMLVSAFATRDFIFNAYNHAIDKKYRFYSYGDCMLIE